MFIAARPKSATGWAKPFWGRGITTSAVRAAVDYAFKTFDICRLFAGVFEGNVASTRAGKSRLHVRSAAADVHCKGAARAMNWCMRWCGEESAEGSRQQAVKRGNTNVENRMSQETQMPE